jgi:hypothetical protein
MREEQEENDTASLTTSFLLFFSHSNQFEESLETENLYNFS